MGLGLIRFKTGSKKGQKSCFLPLFYQYYGKLTVWSWNDPKITDFGPPHPKSITSGSFSIGISTRIWGFLTKPRGNWQFWTPFLAVLDPFFRLNQAIGDPPKRGGFWSKNDPFWTLSGYPSGYEHGDSKIPVGVVMRPCYSRWGVIFDPFLSKILDDRGFGSPKLLKIGGFSDFVAVRLCVESD